jgi:hypothetical protein
MALFVDKDILRANISNFAVHMAKMMRSRHERVDKIPELKFLKVMFNFLPIFKFIYKDIFIVVIINLHR